MRSSLTDLAGPLHAATILDDARLAQKLEGLRSPPDLKPPLCCCINPFSARAQAVAP